MSLRDPGRLGHFPDDDISHDRVVVQIRTLHRVVLFHPSQRVAERWWDRVWAGR